MDAFWPLIRAGLFRFDPETAHGLSIRGLKTGFAPRG
jgi:dihydroorotate dehydrogenase